MRASEPEPRGGPTTRTGRAPRPARRGVGLLEVLVALTILGTVVAAGVTVRGRLERAAFRDARRAAAVEAADALLTRWWSRDAALSHPRLPRRSSGLVPGGGGLAWQTEARRVALTPGGVREAAAAPTGRRPGPPLDRVRLTIHATDTAAALPLYAVELLLPAAAPKPDGGGARRE